MAFLAIYFLGIQGSKIEIEQVFNLARVLIALSRYCLHVNNMDYIIIVVKNWPNDPCANCKPH